MDCGQTQDCFRQQTTIRRWLDGITDSMDMSLGCSGSWWWTGKPGVLQSMGWQRVGHNRATELNWGNLKWSLYWTELRRFKMVSLFLVFYIFSYLLSKRMGCLSGCLVSFDSIHKLFWHICSAFKWSFDEFEGEKVVSPSYSSAILGSPPPFSCWWWLVS